MLQINNKDTGTTYDVVLMSLLLTLNLLHLLLVFILLSLRIYLFAATEQKSLKVLQFRDYLKKWIWIKKFDLKCSKNKPLPRS